MHNPFVYGVPVVGEAFKGRQDELVRVCSRLCARGQATAIVGEPGIGKTSLLSELEGRVETLRGTSPERLIFHYLDAHVLPSQLTPQDFWEQALFVLEEHPLPSEVGEALGLARDNGFASIRLERLFRQLERAGVRLVLMVDEFEALLWNEELGQSGFFGTLRSIASRFPSLGLVLASHHTVDRLHDRSRGFHYGSPILNFVDELTLGPLDDDEVNGVLEPARRRFDAGDLAFVHRVSGGYPLLLQATAAELWELHHGRPELDAVRRRGEVGQRIREVAARTLNANWQAWSAESRRAFAVVALANLSAFGTETQRFDVAGFLGDLDALGPEVRELRRRGILDEDALLPGNLRVRADALLWWFADKAIEVTRPEVAFEDWLRDHQLEGVWRRDEKDRLQAAIEQAFQLVQAGASTLIDSAARGLGAGLVAGV